MDNIKMDSETAQRYLQENALMDYLQDGKDGQNKPNYSDLARLHHVAVRRKSFTVLEFGVGWSTVVLADALRKNKAAWERLQNKPSIRNSTPFQVFAVDSSQEWIDNTKRLIPPDLMKYVEFSYSKVEAGKFNGHMCHFYESIPDVVPDFIYLDAPDPLTVGGAVHGLSWRNPDRTVMAADILVMEPMLLPGTFVLVDGRTNNARFLANNVQRSWEITRYEKEDITTMELLESPLGEVNKETMAYCLEKE